MRRPGPNEMQKAASMIDQIPAVSMSPASFFFEGDAARREDSLQKEARDAVFAKSYGFPAEHAHWVEKIANEAAVLAIQSYRVPIIDGDLEALMKVAGVERISREEGEAFVSLAEGMLVKCAFQLDANPLERTLEASPIFREWMISHLSTHEKRAAVAEKITEALTSAAGKAKDAYNSPSLFGSVGKWLGLGIPVMGVAGYVKGRGDGREIGRQDIVDALAVRLSQLKERYSQENGGVA